MDSEYLGQLINGIAYLVVGAGLARLAYRSGQRPERLLGAYFLLTGCDYFVYAATRIFPLDALPPAGDVVSRVSYAIAVGALVMIKSMSSKQTPAPAVPTPAPPPPPPAA